MSAESGRGEIKNSEENRRRRLLSQGFSRIEKQIFVKFGELVGAKYILSFAAHQAHCEYLSGVIF